VVIAAFGSVIQAENWAGDLTVTVLMSCC